MNTATIFIPGDGTVTVRFPKGLIPDTETTQRIADILRTAQREYQQMTSKHQAAPHMFTDASPVELPTANRR